MPYSVKILNVDHITAYPPPPTVTIPLSFFDTFWIAIPAAIQRIFIFPNSSHLLFSSVLHFLKSSLSRTLATFPSFAGNLTLLPSDADSSGVVVQVPAVAPELRSSGVAFVTAVCDRNINRLTGDRIHDTETFVKLVPELGDCGGILPIPVLAVQATEFANGGVTVGVTIHHAVADGKGVWMFLDTWANECRGAEVVSIPVHDRGVIGLEGGDGIARRFVKEWMPDLPKIWLKKCPQSWNLQQKIKNTWSRRLSFSFRVYGFILGLRENCILGFIILSGEYFELGVVF